MSCRKTGLDFLDADVVHSHDPKAEVCEDLPQVLCVVECRLGKQVKGCRPASYLVVAESLVGVGLLLLLGQDVVSEGTSVSLDSTLVLVIVAQAKVRLLRRLQTRLLQPQHLGRIWIGQNQYMLLLAPLNEFPEPWC